MTTKTCLVDIAKEYAISKHKEKNNLYGDLPYEIHLQNVVNTALNYIELVDERYRDSVVAACWCHDILEDTDQSFNDIKEKLGYHVADLVFIVTDELGRNRIERALQTYLKIMRSNLGTFIKLCDRISNASTSKNNKHPMFNKYKKEHILFKYALYKKGIYEEMWNELEKIFNEE